MAYYFGLNRLASADSYTMRTSLLLPLALVAALGACSGDSAPTTFSDPIAAMDAADSAKAAGDSEAAKAGYDYALQNGDDSLKADAMMGLFEVNVAAGDEAAALANFERMSADFADSLNQDSLKGLIDLTIPAAMVDLGETMLGYAVGKYPELVASLANASLALEKIKSEGPDADLSGLGYAGD